MPRRENTVLRARLQPSVVHVIPNALVAEQFKPPLKPPSGDTSKYFAARYLYSVLNVVALPVTIVVVSRLAYRKGIDLLIATAPRICAMFPNVRFLVGGFNDLHPRK